MDAYLVKELKDGVFFSKSKALFCGQCGMLLELTEQSVFIQASYKKCSTGVLKI